jgi:hypothetical protein
MRQGSAGKCPLATVALGLGLRPASRRLAYPPAEQLANFDNDAADMLVLASGSALSSIPTMSG